MIITEERRQQLIADCKKEKSEIEKCLTTWGEAWRPSLQSKLERQQIALASLEAKPEDRIVDDGYDQYMGGVQISNSLNCAWPLGKVFYGAPPVPVMKPTGLPQTYYSFIQGGKAVMLPAADGQWLNKTQVIEFARAAGYEVKE